MAVETTRGASVAPSTFTPIGEPKVEPKVTWLKDQDYRGSPVMDYDEVPGVRHDEFSGKTFVYWDLFPNLLRAALGSADTVTSLGGGLYSHSIGLINNPNTGSQPPSYTILNDSVDQTYLLTASQLSELNVTFGVDAAVEATFTFMCNPYAIGASVGPVTETVAHLMPAWTTAASIAHLPVTVIEDFELNIKRNTTSIHTIGLQGPYRNWAGPLEVSGKTTMVVEQGTNLNADALVRDSLAYYLQFNDPVTGYSTAFQMSAIQLENPVITVGKAYISLETTFVAVANTSDALNGYSPITTVSINNISGAY